MQPLLPWEIKLAALISRDRYKRCLEMLKEYDELKLRSVNVTVNQFRKRVGHKPADHPNAPLGAASILDPDNGTGAGQSLNSTIPAAAVTAAKAELEAEYGNREMDAKTPQQVAEMFPDLFAL